MVCVSALLPGSWTPLTLFFNDTLRGRVHWPESLVMVGDSHLDFASGFDVNPPQKDLWKFSLFHRCAGLPGMRCCWNCLPSSNPPLIGLQQEGDFGLAWLPAWQSRPAVGGCVVWHWVTAVTGAMMRLEQTDWMLCPGECMHKDRAQPPGWWFKTMMYRRVVGSTQCNQMYWAITTLCDHREYGARVTLRDLGGTMMRLCRWLGWIRGSAHG